MIEQQMIESFSQYFQNILVILLGCYIGWIIFSNLIRKYLYSMLDSKVYEMGKSFTEHLINQTKGFECRVYTCKTKDGCKLQLFRIIYKGIDNENLNHQSTITYCSSTQQVEELLRESEQLSKKPVVVLQHGLLEAMTVFVLHEESIAFQLAKKGFDVWLANNRTSLFGQQHLMTRIHDEVEFWKFSIDEIAKYDMPAIIDFIRNATNQPRICWVGMSQGAGQLFAALSQTEYAHYKNYLSAIVGISPACFLQKNPESAFLRFLIGLPSFVFGRREFMLIILIGQLLLPASLLAIGGEYALKQLLNIQQKPLPNHPLKGEWFKNIPLGCTSVNNVVHWLKMLKIGGCLRKFNGLEKYPIDELLDRWREVYHSNLSHHNQDNKKQEYVPPLFVFLGGKDNVINYEESIKHFGCCDSVLVTDETDENPVKNGSTCPGSSDSNNVRCKILFDAEYGHTDFLWSEPNAKHQRHYDKVIQFLEEHVKS